VHCWRTGPARVLGAAEELDAAITALRGARDSQLTVAASFTVAEYLLPTWLARLRIELGPRTGVNLVVRNTTEVMELVLSGNAGLGFIEGPDLRAGLDTVTVATDRLLLIVPAGHPWTRRRAGIHAVELASTPLVAREPGSGTRAVIDNALERAAPRRTPPAPRPHSNCPPPPQYAKPSSPGPGPRYWPR
jgi:DNA-binding transcriptional LysR family regulator